MGFFLMKKYSLLRKHIIVKIREYGLSNHQKKMKLQYKQLSIPNKLWFRPDKQKITARFFKKKTHSSIFFLQISKKKFNIKIFLK